MTIPAVPVAMFGGGPSVGGAASAGSAGMARGADLGGADSKSGVFNCWVNFNDSALNGSMGGGASTSFFEVLRNAGKIQIIGTNAAGSVILKLQSTGTYAAGSGWHHVLSSWDLAAGLGTLYVDGVDVKDAAATILTNDTLDYTQTNWWTFRRHGGTATLNGALAELLLRMGTYIDFTVLANREKFMKGGKPVNLGSDGSTAVGAVPQVFHHLDVGEAVADFATNRGSGGNYTISGGSLTYVAGP